MLGRRLVRQWWVGVLVLAMCACPGSATTQSMEQEGGTTASAGKREARRLQVPAADTLDIGDAVEVKVFGEPELGGAAKVRSDGTVALPLVGLVEVRGKTPEQAAAIIAEAYSKGYLRNPQVNVTVTAFNSKRFYVLGAVNSPGVFPYEYDMNALRAVIMAGGFQQGASRNSVLITRQVNGREVRMEVPVDDIGQGRARNVPVFPGDIIYVPTSLL